MNERPHRSEHGRAGPAVGRERTSTTWRELTAVATETLADEGVGNAAQEARWLAQRAGGFDAADLQVALDERPTERSAAFFHAMVERRTTGMPLQYVMERWDFRTLELFVDRRVLIPRPETEVLAERALAECDRLNARVAVDLGTGSGAIALSLAVERPSLAEIWATDVSPDALAVARANLAGLGRAATRVRLSEGSWFAVLPEDLRGRVELLVSNPPYVAEPEMPELPDEVRDWEPVEALVSGPEGLDAVAEILAAAPAWLARPASVLLEMAPHQTDRATAMARSAGFTAVSVWPDLAGRDRILQARL